MVEVRTPHAKSIDPVLHASAFAEIRIGRAGGIEDVGEPGTRSVHLETQRGRPEELPVGFDATGLEGARAQAEQPGRQLEQHE